MGYVINGYEYDVLESFDSNGNPIEITEEEIEESARSLDAFLSDVEEHTDEEINEWKSIKSVEGLTDRVCSKLYEIFYDECYFGNREEKWFLDAFDITRDELGKILM